MMRILLALALGALSLPALAGSVKDEPVAAAPGSYFHGVYFGAHVGYGWGDSKITDNLPALGVPLPALTSTHEADGFLGGLHLGARRQFGSLVIGAELGASGSKIKGTSGNCMNLATLLAPIASTCETEVNWMITPLAKVGFAVDKVLVYAAAGWTVAGVNHSHTLSFGPVALASARSDILDGLTLGGGVEYAIGNGLSLGLEYLYRDLESKGTGMLLGGIVTTGNRDLELHSVTANFNIRF